MKKIIQFCLLFLLSSGILFSQSVVYRSGDWLGNVTFIPTGGTSIYDLQSDGSPQHIWQDPNIPGNIHAVYMSSPVNDPYPNFPGRVTKYYYSSNYGTNWSFSGNVSSLRTGFPCITGTSSGNALIGVNIPYASGPIRVVLFLDAFPGLGSFTILDPGYAANRVYQYPRAVATQNVSLTNKFLYICSYPSDSGFINIFLASGNFSGYQFFNGRPTEGYSVARGSDGRIGITYIADENISPIDRGNVFYMESTNNGTTFSVPLKIFQRQYITDSNIVGAFRGIFIAYQGNSPKVVFETVRQTLSGSYYPTLSSAVRFWSPVLPGPDPYKSIVIADSTNVPLAPIVGVNDDLSPICRPVIGASSDSTRIYVAFMVASSQLGGASIPTNYNDMYFTYSQTNGNTWYSPVRITPLSPRRDWTYPSISPINSYTGTGSHFANLVMQSDSIPGSYIHGNSNGASLARQMFVRVEIPDSLPPNTPPNAPTIICPMVHHWKLEWYSVWNANTYKVQYTTDSTFLTGVVSVPNITNTYLQLTGLTQNTKYWWRVNATNTYGTSPYSSVCTIAGDTAQYFSVSGNVKYRDNNQIVTSGYVKALFVNRSTGQITVLDSCLIQSDGTYQLPNVHRYDSAYISGYPNSNQNVDFMPTFYPSTIDWESASLVSVNSNLTNINISVFRIYEAINYSLIEGIVSKSAAITSGALSGALVYSKMDTLIRGFAITDEYGHYTLDYMPSGTHKIMVNRIGYKSDSMTVILNLGANLNGINFTLNPYWVGINSQSGEIPTSFRLYQNYPNPFNPTTKIKFDVPSNVRSETSNEFPLSKGGLKGVVMLKVYDILGREIQTLVNEKLSPGSYEVTFDGSNFASGVYFYQLKSGDYIENKKMILIK